MSLGFVRTIRSKSLGAQAERSKNFYQTRSSPHSTNLLNISSKPECLKHFGIVFSLGPEKKSNAIIILSLKILITPRLKLHVVTL